MPAIAFEPMIFHRLEVKGYQLLATSNTEHLCAAAATYTLGGRFAVFHCYRLGIFHFFFGTTLNTIGFHLFTSHLSVAWNHQKSTLVFFMLFKSPRKCFRLFLRVSPYPIISPAGGKIIIPPK